MFAMVEGCATSTPIAATERRLNPVEKFKVRWDNGKKVEFVEDTEQLDKVLDRAEKERGPDGHFFVIDITNGKDEDGVSIGLHMTAGHPIRNRVFWVGPGDCVGY